MSVGARKKKKRRKSVTGNLEPESQLTESAELSQRTRQHAGASTAVSPHESQQTHSVFGRAILGVALLWLAFPPVGLWFVGWIAVAPLISLIALKKLPGRKPYLKIWFAGLIYWLVTFYFIPIPHWALWFGWMAVSLYLALYLPLFIGISRTMVYIGRIPIFVAAPTVWVGLELIRSYLFTGMGLVCLSHTQYQQPLVIQAADLSGAYTLSFALALVGTCAYLFLFGNSTLKRPSFVHLVIGVLAIGSVLIYGNFRLSQQPVLDSGKQLKVGLIQGSMDATFPKTLEERRKFHEELTEQYCSLTQQALTQWPDTDLIIWPESAWPTPDLLPDTDLDRLPPDEVRAAANAQFDYWSQATARSTTVPEFLVGTASFDPVDGRVYGAAVRIGINGMVTERYFKNHLVMFGEYVPLSKWIPLLRRIPEIGRGLNAGTESISMDFNQIKLAPSICFETTVPHYIRAQINKLADAGEEPDVMINLTNDGWFYGTSCLDFHLACNVFRAVEMRKPQLVCANTGFSAEINDRGQILQQGPRRATGIMRATIVPRQTESRYRGIGDIIPFSMAAVCIVFGFVGLVAMGKRRQTD